MIRWFRQKWDNLKNTKCLCSSITVIDAFVSCLHHYQRLIFKLSRELMPSPNQATIMNHDITNLENVIHVLRTAPRSWLQPLSILMICLFPHNITTPLL